MSPSNSISPKTGFGCLEDHARTDISGYRRLYPHLQAIKFGHLERDPQPECLGDENQTWVFNHLRVLGFDSLEIFSLSQTTMKVKSLAT